MKPNVLALIPARGGSKGVPGKNKRIVGGKPLIFYTIDEAIASSRVTHVAVTTDDSDIVSLAEEIGILVIQRPSDIAGDTSPVIDAVRHALEELRQKQQLEFDAIVLLQPTSPLRSAEDIDNVISLFFEGELNPVCSVYQCDDNHPARMYTIENGKLASLMPELSSVRRQDLPPVYHRNGVAYVFGQREVESGEIISSYMTPYVMPIESAINIDNELDFALLENIIENND